jgi:peptidoglycan/xylan/chitin deacetylase (PgdA/CDA1 family)
MMFTGISQAMAENRFPRAMITFRFDDANTSQLGLIELINRKGMPATVFAIVGYAGRQPYLSMKELLDLQKKGNEVGSHSLTHCRLTFTGKKRFLDETACSFLCLKENGIKCTSFAYPYGMTNPFFDSYVRKIYSQAADYPTVFSGDFNYPDSDIYRLTCHEALDAEDVQRLLDRAVSEKLWLVISFHWIREGSHGFTVPMSVAGGIVEKISDYRKKGLIEAVTMAGGAEKIRRIKEKKQNLQTEESTIVDYR